MHAAKAGSGPFPARHLSPLPSGGAASARRHSTGVRPRSVLSPMPPSPDSLLRGLPRGGGEQVVTGTVCDSFPLLAKRLRMLRSDIWRRAAMGGMRESVAGKRVTSAFMSLRSSSSWFSTGREEERPRPVTHCRTIAAKGEQPLPKEGHTAPSPEPTVLWQHLALPLSREKGLHPPAQTSRECSNRAEWVGAGNECTKDTYGRRPSTRDTHMTLVRGDTRETNQRDLRNAGSEIHKRNPHDTRMRTNVGQCYSHDRWWRDTQEIVTGHRETRSPLRTREMSEDLLERSIESNEGVKRCSGGHSTTTPRILSGVLSRHAWQR